MNPWALLGGVVVWLASLWYAFDFGRDHEAGEQARVDNTARLSRESAARAIGDALAKLEVQRVEITQPIIREVQQRVVYRDCRHTADGLRGLNAALTGRAEPVGAGQLPAASAPR